MAEVGGKAAGVSESEGIELGAGDDGIEESPGEFASSLGENSVLSWSSENPDDVGAAGGVTESLGDFRRLIVERSVAVSFWRTFTFYSNFKKPLYLFLRLVSRELTLEMWASLKDLVVLAQDFSPLFNTFCAF